MRHLALALLLSAVAVSRGAPAQDLTPEHRRWLEEEVTYLITERETDVFLSLGTVDERDRFIEAFWRKRDPVPGTPANEFREEHYRRFEYASRELRGEAFAPGWKTDRGRMHIILGPPRSIETFDNYNNLYTSQLWFYNGDPGRNTPSFFYLLFFKRLDATQYRLFIPGADVPGDLIRGSTRSFPERNMEQLLRISPELARAALAVDASEPVDIMGGTVGLGSQAAIARIEASPRYAIRTDYLDAWERYGSRVSSEYSFNFVPSEGAFAVLAGPDRTAYLHFSVELDLENLPMDTNGDGSRSFTTLDASLEVRDPHGRLVLADDKEAFVQLRTTQRNAIRGSTFAYQDGVPLAPGDYEVMLILRNRVSSQYTVAEHSVRVSDFSGGQPALSDLLVGFRTEAMPEDGAAAFKTFQAGAARIHPAVGGVFASSENLHAALQLLSADPSHDLHFALLRGEEVVAERTRDIVGTEPAFLEERFSLEGAVADRYELRVRLLDAQGSVLAEKTAPFSISPRASIPRPGLFARRSFDAGKRALLAVVLGDQHWAMENFAEAERLFESAVSEGDPEVPQAQWKLAASYLRSGKTESALGLLLPLQYEHADRYEVVVGLGLGFYLKGNLTAAVSHLEKAVSLRPPQPGILNALGDAYFRLGDKARAREAFERSVAIDPEQPDIQKSLAELGSGVSH